MLHSFEALTAPLFHFNKDEQSHSFKNFLSQRSVSHAQCVRPDEGEVKFKSLSSCFIKSNRRTKGEGGGTRRQVTNIN